ncbi:hypothetical protein NC652_019181 [Populus alba x Populus x berolinensis]|nr:hypothetical protein NC652_019181 [Populus alba x Populus x berolinensis]
MAEERGLQVDQAGGAIVIDVNATLALHKKGISATDDSFKFIWFDIFYTRVIEGPFGLFQVCDVQIFGGFILHIDSLTAESGRFSTGDKVICKVDYDRRKLIAPTHTCTHMLNFALREVLDNHVDRKGSTILLEKLRFDFSHVDPELLRKIESIVNGQIKDELDVFAKTFALLSEEGIAKIIRSITVVTINCAFKKQWNWHTHLSLKLMRHLRRKSPKRICRKAIKFTVEMAEVTSSDRKGFCISHVDVGLDAAVLKVLEHKVVAFSGSLCSTVCIDFPLKPGLLTL